MDFVKNRDPCCFYCSKYDNCICIRKVCDCFCIDHRLVLSSPLAQKIHDGDKGLVHRFINFQISEESII